MNKTNFFSVLMSVCTGTSLFPEIAQFKIFKAVWQLFILVVLASIAFSMANYTSISKSIESGSLFMQKTFGDILVKDNGIYPSLEENKERHVDYAFMRVDYIPDSESFAKFKFDPGTSYSGFIWTPYKVIGWLKLNDSQIVVYPAVTTQYDTRFISIYPKDQFENYIKYSDKLETFKNLMLRVCIQAEVPVVGAAGLKSSNSFMEFTKDFSMWSSFIVFFKFFISAFFNVIFYSLIFAAIYAFTEKGGVLNYKFKNFFLIAVYAAFPAVIIGTIFESAQSQYLDYSTVFLIAFVIYLFVITNKLKANGLKKNNQI
ncbi:MAG TPA: hypothetical protein DD381_02405 [Lentisphaeria bacterium]|nr:MAG: hypothetical protein A2X47_08630 [Lentisphaerae bacterium GWF2_38_69]HBM15187.1 hypothetical protein [Lentisphaeria bacterium]